MQPRLTIVPLELADANGLVAGHHRHHFPVPGHRFGLGAFVDERLVGFASRGRPLQPGEGPLCRACHTAKEVNLACAHD